MRVVCIRSRFCIHRTVQVRLHLPAMNGRDCTIYICPFM